MSFIGRPALFVLVLCTLTISRWGYATPFTAQSDSLLIQWQQVASGELDLSDSDKVSLLIRIGESIQFHSPDSALSFYEIAYPIAREQGMEKQIGDLLNMRGYVHYILGNYDLALSYFVDALAIHEKLENAIGISKSLNYIALIYETQKNYAQALLYQWRSIVYSKISGDTTRLIANYYNIAIVHDANLSSDSALYYLDVAQKLSEKQRNYHMYSMAMNKRGDVMFDLGMYKEAERLYQQVLSYPYYKDNWETCFANSGLAQVYMKTQKYDASIEHGLIALEVARQMKSKWEISNAARILFESYKAQNNYERALSMHELHKSYSDSLYSQAKEKEINYLHLRQNETERDRLAKENALQRATIEKSNLWIGFFIILGILMAIWGLALYQNSRHRLLSNKQLIKKNENIAERNAKIEEQNRELNALNETKNQLLSIIGHDMRGPINNIKTILEIIKDGRLSQSDQERVFKDLHKTISSVSDTMNNMLSWASSQLKGLQINPGTVKLASVVNEKVEFFTPSATDKGITIVHESDEDVFVFADVNHLKTVLRNLISNSIKFTKRNGKVTISYRTLESDEVEIKVTDTGVGISEDQLKNIFLFTGRSQSIGTNNERGTGIGLMLSKEFIESNKGKISVSSKVGVGTEFIIVLPAAQLVEATT
ncbi:MAG: tetratricopeptide repeat protein [Cyclobacteriaceae bacterium]|nr:tetratricopeptide repeat protein [Cyclobacteriaceae bacterium]